MYIDLEKFQKSYYENVKPLEENLENEKSDLRKKIAKMIILGIILGTVLIWIIPLGDVLFTILGVMGVAVVMLSYFSIWDFTTKTKRTIYPELFKSIDPNLIYTGKLSSAIDDIRASLMFPEDIYSFPAEDSIAAKINDKEVVMYEVKVKKTGRDNKTVFAGIFINIKMDKPVKDRIKIIQNTSKDFGFFNSFNSDESKVNLENIEFEAMYDVYCDDQIYARKILNLTFMDKLVNATNKLNKKLKISFINNNVYIAISDMEIVNDKLLFTQKIDILNIAKDIDNIIGVVDALSYLNMSEKV